MFKKLFCIPLLVLLAVGKAQVQTFEMPPSPSKQPSQRAVIPGAYLDVLKDVKIHEKVNGKNPYVINNLLTFKMLNKEFCDVCQELATYKSKGWRLNSYQKKYFKYFCPSNPNLSKNIKKFFEQKACRSFNPNDRVFTKDDTLRGQLTPIRACYDVRHYDLRVRFDVKNKTIEGSNTITFDLLERSDKIQIDAHKQLNIKAVQMDGKDLKFDRFNNVLFVYLPASEPAKGLKLTVSYDGKPAEAIDPPWQGGFIWKQKGGKPWAGVTCEHLGSSVWWPSKDHPSDEPDSMKTHFEVPEELEVVSNGNLDKVEPLSSKYKAYHWKISYPINTYNVTFYIGDFSYFKSQLTDSVGTQDLEYYVLPKNVAKAKQHYKISEEVVKFYSEAFGEFPFKKDGFCLVESPYAGMEHQTAIAIGTKYGKENRYVAVKDDYLIIHEAAHEWWGNSVTAKDMAHAWIQEGFATYAELLFIENKYGHPAYLKETLVKEFSVFNFWPVVGEEGLNDNTFISGDIYDKGALFLHSLRTTIDNDKLFFEIIKTFANRYKYKQVVTQDFLNVVNELTQEDYEPFFKAYLYQTLVPTLEYKYHYDEKQGKSIITSRWTNVPAGFKMPFAMYEKEGEFHRVEASTQWSTFKVNSDKPIRFVGFREATDCPRNYTTYHYTKMIED